MDKTCYFIVFFCLLFAGGIATSQNKQFINYSINEGLSQSEVLCILQDRDGFLWFGTKDGLNKFDGYKFTVYRTDVHDTNSVSNVNINCIYEDKDGILWVGTIFGLNSFDKVNCRFTHYFHNPKNYNSISDNHITSISEDNHGNLWVGTLKGLNKLNKRKHIVTRYLVKRNYKNSISDNSITIVFKDSKGIIWAGTKYGLNKITAQTGIIETYLNEKGNPGSISDNSILSIGQDSIGDIWVGTEHGICRYNQQSNNFFRLGQENRLFSDKILFIFSDTEYYLWVQLNKNLIVKYDVKKNTCTNYEMPDQQVISFFVDKTRNLWVSTFNNGIYKHDLNRKLFRNYLPGHNIWTIYEDSEKNVWLGSSDNGLIKFHTADGSYKYYSHDPDNVNSISGNDVRSIKEDAAGNLWIGTFSGLNLFDKKKGSFTRFVNDPSNRNSLSNNTIRTIHIDGSGQVWLATRGGGIDVFDPKQKIFRHLKNLTSNQYSFNCKDAYYLTLSPDSSVWIGTYGEGLCKIDLKENRSFLFRKEQKNSISDNEVLYITNDLKNNLWVGTACGLNKIEPGKSGYIYKIRNFTEKDGLPNNMIYSIVNDRKDFLWLATNNGICKFREDSNSVSVKSYNVDDGLQSNEFNACACFMNDDGQIFMGGINGFTVFHPDSITDNIILPKVAITDFLIFNKNVEIWNPVMDTGIKPDPGHVVEFQKKYYITSDISSLKEITLSYKESIITFNFAALHYSVPERNKYAYILEGFESDWNFVGTKRTVTYTNLPPGRYVFKVKASNCDNVWNNNPTCLKLIVTPPFWQTWWFRLLLVVVTISVIVIIIRFRFRKLMSDKLILQKTVDERTSEVITQKEEIMKQRDKLQEIISELEKLSIVARETENAIVIADNNFKVEWVNPGWTKLYGYTLEEYTSASDNLIELSKNKNFHIILEECLVSKKSVTYQTRHETKENKELWIQTTLTPVTDANGEIFKLVAIDSDITKLKEAENEIILKNEILKKKTKEIKLLSEIGQDITSILSVKHIIETVYIKINTLIEAPIFLIGIFNPGKNRLEVTGGKEAGELPFFFWDIDDENLASWCFKNQKEIIINDFWEEYRNYIPNFSKPKIGKITESIICFPLTLNEKKIGIITIQSYKKDAYTDYHLNIIKNIAVYVSIALDNANAYNQIGLQKEKIEQTFFELQNTQAQLIQSEKMAALGLLIAGIAHEINTPLGAIRASASNILNTLLQTLGELPGFTKSLDRESEICFFTLLKISLLKEVSVSPKEERTYRKELIKKLDEQNFEDSETIADFFVDMGIYDDFTPFVHILRQENYLTILQMAYKLSSMYRSSVTINTATDKASKVVFALKNFAHFDTSGVRVKSNIINGIDTVLVLYQNLLKHGIELVKNYSEIPETMCFPDELNQVWTNIIHNAIHAMKNKGTLTIDVCHEPVNHEIRVSFTDTGCGISADNQKKIFQPFFTTKAQGEGSGLGLDIARKIVEKHNGRISFESVPGKTTFFVFLPVIN